MLDDMVRGLGLTVRVEDAPFEPPCEPEPGAYGLDLPLLICSQALDAARIPGETGGCPHTAVREDASMNLAALPMEHRQLSG